MKNLSDMLSSLQETSSSGTSPFSPTNSDIERDTAPGSAGYMLQQGGDKVRYINLSSWNAMCQHVSEIDEILFSKSQESSDHNVEVGIEGGEEPSASDIDVPPTMLGVTSRSQSQRSSNISASFWARFPSKDICDAALTWYFRGYHPLVPLVRVPSFRRQYEQFWTAMEREDRGRTDTISFATLLLSFVFAGSVAGGEQQSLTLPNSSWDDTITQLYRLVARALKLAQFPHAPTLDTLRAYLIQQSLRMREEEPLSSVAFVGLSLRVANILGLHKDPKHFAQLSEVEGEVRRRVWWQLVHIDVCLAVAVGLPPLIDVQS